MPACVQVIPLNLTMKQTRWSTYYVPGAVLGALYAGFHFITMASHYFSRFPEATEEQGNSLIQDHRMSMQLSRNSNPGSPLLAEPWLGAIPVGTDSSFQRRRAHVHTYPLTCPHTCTALRVGARECRGCRWQFPSSLLELSLQAKEGGIRCANGSGFRDDSLFQE